MQLGLRPARAPRSGPRSSSPTAERFGFNQPPDVPGIAESTLPQANKIGDDLAVGSTAIGQGDVQASALEMAVGGGDDRQPRPAPALRVDLDSRRQLHAA